MSGSPRDERTSGRPAAGDTRGEPLGRGRQISQLRRAGTVSISVSGYVAEVTWHVWEEPAGFIRQSCIDAVVEPGGAPLVIAANRGAVRERESFLQAADGLGLAEGKDIDPGTYCAATHAETAPFVALRDSSQFGLSAGALAADSPMLAVCRGCEVLGAACGGTLNQEIADDVPPHRASSRARANPLASGQLTGGHMKRILASDALVPSHHRAGSDVDSSVRPTAFAEDELIEGIGHAPQIFVRVFSVIGEQSPTAEVLSSRG